MKIFKQLKQCVNIYTYIQFSNTKEFIQYIVNNKLVIKVFITNFLFKNVIMNKYICGAPTFFF